MNKLKSERIIPEKIKDRYFAIDMNPNYVGYTVIDWIDGQNYKIIDKGCFSLKFLNDYDDSLKGKGFSSESKERKYISNKHNYEISDIAHELERIANHYQCENFVMEDLSIPSKDNGKGKRFNRLCNLQWCRNRFCNILKKLCELHTTLKSGGFFFLLHRQCLQSQATNARQCRGIRLHRGLFQPLSSFSRTKQFYIFRSMNISVT